MRPAAQPALAEPEWYDVEAAATAYAAGEEGPDPAGAVVDPSGALVGGVEEDPAPGYADTPGKSQPVIEGKDGVPATTRRDIAGLLSVFIMLPAETLILIDPYCGEVFSKCAPRMVKSLVPIICQSPAAVQFVISKTGLILWAQFYVACAPLLKAVIAHHITHRVSIERDEQDGTRHIVKTDFSQYSAA